LPRSGRALARGHQYGFDVLEQTGLTSGTVYPALERLERVGASGWVAAEYQGTIRAMFEGSTTTGC